MAIVFANLYSTGQTSIPVCPAQRLHGDLDNECGREHFALLNQNAGQEGNCGFEAKKVSLGFPVP